MTFEPWEPLQPEANHGEEKQRSLHSVPYTLCSIILFTFLGGYLTALLFNLWGINALMSTPAHIHLIIGGFAFGAVFMATDPVTATQTNKGKIIYGFLVGFFAIVIRVFNPAYPEGMMLAILFMNVFAPLIDHYIIEANVKKRLGRLKVSKA